MKKKTPYRIRNWSAYNAALAAAVNGGPVEGRLTEAVRGAERNGFVEEVLQTENHLNRALYAVLQGNAGSIHPLFARAGYLDEAMLAATEWKLRVLSYALTVIGPTKAQMAAAEAFRQALDLARREDTP